MNELIVNNPQQLARTSDGKDNYNNFMQRVEYLALDDNHFSFTSKPYDFVTITMEESNYEKKDDIYEDAEFFEDVDEDTKAYYILAATSGFITGVLDSINLIDIINDLSDDKNENKFKDVIVKIARVIGYTKNDFKGAAKYIANTGIAKFKEGVSVDSLLKESLKYLHMHPTYAGLFFSILTQFEGKKCELTEDGKIKKSKLPDYYAIGNTREEKLVYGFLYFVFYIVSAEIISNRRIIDNIGMPKEIIKMLKELSDNKLFKMIPTNFGEAEKIYSELIMKIFNYDEIIDEDGNKVKFNFSEIVLAVAKNLENGIGAVVLNECITRGIYVVKKFFYEIRKNEITAFSDINKINFNNIVPYNSELLSKMSLISSGVFVAVNVGKAVLKAAKGKGAADHKFVETMLAEINIAGVGVFIYHLSANAKNIRENARVFFEKMGKDKKNKTENNNYEDINVDDDVFKIFQLSPAESLILYSLEAAYIKSDIRATKKEEDRAIKQAWYDEWKQALRRGFGINSDDIFDIDEDILYNGIYELAKNKDLWGKFYLLTIELVLFEPYREIGSKNDKAYKKLKTEIDYIKDVFVRRQTIVSQEEVDNIAKNYNKYKNSISGNAKNVVVGLGIAAVATIASGGAAMALAPQIAVIIAGEAVAGLHGAALINASLAFVGGGSLAAGGLGMAGGTAIITGGGAMIGLAGSGTTSIIAFSKQVPPDYWTRQSSKILTLCNCIIDRGLDEKADVKRIYDYMKKAADDISKEIDLLNKEDNDLEKENIASLKDYYKAISKCTSELKKIISDIK